MANPTSGWDKVPVYGVWMEIDDITPKMGEIVFTITDRIVRVDGTRIYPKGGTIKRKLGEVKAEDQSVHDAVRQNLRDAAAALPGFNGAEWDAAWAAGAAGRMFVQFPAKDDQDIVQTDWQVKVEEKLTDGSGQTYYIEPTLGLLPAGLNLGTIAIPPNSPSAPAPIYAKGVAGGVASLDADGKVPLLQLPDVTLTDYSSVSSLSGYPATFPPALGTTGSTAAAGNDARLSNARTPLAHTHTAAQITDLTEATQDAVAAFLQGASGVTLSYNDAANTLTITGGGAAGLDAEAVRDAIGVALIGTGVISVLVNDAADTITITSSATANSTDATLLARANHTGTQAASTISDSTTVGRSVLTAGSAAAARTAIGAGTSSLAVGTGASDAKAGNYTPTLADMPAGSQFAVYKSGSTWPARPSSRTDLTFEWIGADPSPAIVTSGTAGMYSGDKRTITA